MDFKYINFKSIFKSKSKSKFLNSTYNYMSSIPNNQLNLSHRKSKERTQKEMGPCNILNSFLCQVHVCVATCYTSIEPQQHSILVHLVHFDPIWSILVYFGPLFSLSLSQ